MFHYKLARHQDPREAGKYLLREVSAWTNDCIRRYADAPPLDTPDQAIYATGWLPLLYFEPTHPGAHFLLKIRDQVARHFKETEAWRHGYWRMADVTSGMQHFEIFLAQLARLDGDMATIGQVLDAAEHIGNWSENVRPWYDEETACFPSHTLGAEGFSHDSFPSYNTPAHFHLINLALVAYRINQSERYAKFAIAYGGRWADAILMGDMLPVGLDAKGPVYEPRIANDSRENVHRAEALLAEDAIQALLKIWNISRDDRFRDAAERILDTLMPELLDPDAGGLAGAIRFYRRMTRANRYDSQVLDSVSHLLPDAVEVIDLDVAPIFDTDILGLGKCADLPHWKEDGQIRQHNPIVLGLAAEISNNAHLATISLDLATAYLSLAQRAFSDGREDSDSARTVSAVARGHARDNGAGVVTEVLVPLMARFK
ncbi:hypothetical protein [Cerasicoccus arenae]|uniref:Uncharacterized protein n=1 Tax=Cerasicoccus arenae TaxID=424488 RepID=A0A8J3GDK6_9BACT|nr:hypothetical protein [Cerasicoccus arenae]MBK1858737.1 hypothetical protein [Cerasicoccus arenae]GHC07225.1 hypothetical protein GCM10007047_25340 [Cerasicoccus arenae]